MTPMLEFQGVSYTYAPKGDRKRAEKAAHAALKSDEARDWGNAPKSIWALLNVSFSIEDGEFVGLVGHTGSGKSTLIQLAAGLMKPTEGSVRLNGLDLREKAGLREARGAIGIVFQYPENQLFAQTVCDDVAFGPRNLGLPAEEVDRRVASALSVMGLDVGEIGAKSPFAISGGQQRRVAIAGVLAMHPKLLILDEPTAGLDPASHDSLLSLIARLKREHGLTVILVSHNMDDVAGMCDRVMALDRGKVFEDGAPAQVFSDAAAMKSIGLGTPSTLKLAGDLGIEVAGIPTVDELASLIAKEAAHAF